MRPEAKGYVERIMDCYLDGKDETIRELVQELQSDQELFLDVWSSFATASLRRRLKQIIQEGSSESENDGL